MRIKGYDTIPNNLEECFEAIKEINSSEELEEFKKSPEDQTYRLHHGFGQWMRNYWGLWGGSSLRDYFNSIGLYHADDMSSLILITFHRHLNNKPLNVETEVERFREYWRKVGIDPDTRKIIK